MDNFSETRHEVARITCIVHQQLSGEVTNCLRTLGVQSVLVESARCVRQRMRARFSGLPGLLVNLTDDPMEIFRTTVPRASAERVVRALAATADLHTPGHGSIYAQDLFEVARRCDPPEIQPGVDGDEIVLRDMTLLTGILSMAGSGDALAGIALKLGAAVPVISLGSGTGIRDRLGLLRITIPPEKELVHLMVPTHDAAGLQRLLIEEGRFDRPGGGFLYQTPIRAGVVDPLMRIGRQEHAASIEQVIAAIDDLKKGTAWRKRFLGLEPGIDSARRLVRNHREIGFICTEGQTAAFVYAAMCAGAAGATTARLRRLCFKDTDDGVAACERGILCVPAAMASAVVDALCQVAVSCGDPVFRLQLIDAPIVFSHQRNGESQP
ncbi:hypothetical protein P4E94_12275 [Pontiellaceae bacterium B12219]|nr:hypothetical protein [Pontiellaceae bacterium B12219]